LLLAISSFVDTSFRTKPDDLVGHLDVAEAELGVSERPLVNLR
jgi:hypothetical protein